MRSLFGDILDRLGARTYLLLVSVIVNGLIQGVGISLLFPLLAVLGIGGESDKSRLEELTSSILSYLGIPFSLPWILGLVVVVFALQLAVFLIQSYLSATYQNRYIASWRCELFDAMMDSQWRFFVHKRSGDLINSITVESDRLSTAFVLLVELFSIGVFFLVYVGLAFSASWQVAASLGAFAIVMYLTTRPLIRSGLRVGKEITDVNNDLQSATGEFLSGAKLLKATATEWRAKQELRGFVERAFRLLRWRSFHPNLLRGLLEFAGIVGLCVALGVSLGVFNVPAASALITVVLFVRLYNRLPQIPQNLQMLNLYLPAFWNARQILQECGAARERASADRYSFKSRLSGVRLDVENLRVEYDQLAALRGISVTFSEGACVGLVGASGSGKTTLVDCLLGLIKPVSGEIKIDGQALSQMSLDDWRRAVGYVAQDTVLFHASIRENIRWAHPDADENEIVRAARAAHAHEFIDSLSRRYDTVVGDRGLRLSGGQRQRIGLARALLGPKSLLILDEATSALDSQSESIVLDAVRSLKGRMTIVMIAHRLSTVRNADRVFLIEKGEVAQEGTWQSLIQEDGPFRRLWEIQSKEGFAAS